MTARPPEGGSPLDRLALHFDELITLGDAAEQARFIDDVRSREPQLASELEDLFRAHLEETHFLDGLRPDDLAVVSDEIERGAVRRRLGNWQVEGVLHHGGMGTVYRAHRVDADFEQVAAIKVIRLGAENPDSVRRFTMERQLLARLEHPSIARLLDGGTTPDGMQYIVMEYVPGDPIDQWCERANPSVDELIEVFQAVCAAVDFAHRNLVIHRDIKPGNILVTADGRPKLLDFGIARLEDEAAGDETVPLTRYRLMTPAYASPEQYRGEPVTTASDVYSLGVLLYRLLAGAPPYRIDDTTTIREAEQLICDTMPPPPSRVTLRGQRRSRQLRGDLDTIVLKALRKEPQRRYPSALALAEDLQRFRDGLPVSARPDTFSYRARRFATRNWPALTAATTILAALAVGLGSALWQAAAAERQRDIARAEAATAESAVEFLKTVLWAGNPWDEASHVETVSDVLRQAEVQLDDLLGSEPAVRSYILAALTEISVGRGDLEQALRFSADAVTTLENSPPAARLRAGEVYRAHSLALHELGRNTEALEYAHRALEGLQSQRPLRTEGVSESLNLIGVIHADLGDFAEAESWYRRALQFRQENGADSPEKLVRVMNNLAVALMSQPERLEEAARAFDDAIPMARRAGAAPPVIGTLLTNQANVYTLLEDVAAAEAAYVEALEVMRPAIGADHPSSLTTAVSLASLYEFADDLARAEATLRPVLATALSTLPADHPTTAYAQNVLALTLCRQGGRAAALDGLELARASLRTRAAGLPPDHWALASGASVEALCLIELGRHDDARPLLERAIPLLVEQRGADHRLSARARAWYSRIPSAGPAH